MDAFQITLAIISTIILLLTLIATFITSIGTLRTVKEIKKQRETSYHPELYLGNQIIYFYSFPHNGANMPFGYSTKQLGDALKNFNYSENAIELHNVGFAVAKAIEYNWVFDFQAGLAKINKLNTSGFFHIYLEKYLNISVTKHEFTRGYNHNTQFEKKFINYILPSSIQKSPVTIPMPIAYIDLYIIFHCYYAGYYGSAHANELIKRMNEDSEGFPPIFLILSYKDLEGKNHKKQFKFHLEVGLSISPDTFSEKIQELGYHTFIVTEVSD
jgi:hypothetical protein